LVCKTKPTRSTQPCIPLGSLNQVPALIGRGKGGKVTYAGWQVTLSDPIWHMGTEWGKILYGWVPFPLSFLHPVDFLNTAQYYYSDNFSAYELP